MVTHAISVGRAGGIPPVATLKLDSAYTNQTGPCPSCTLDVQLGRLSRRVVVDARAAGPALEQIANGAPEGRVVLDGARTEDVDSVLPVVDGDILGEGTVSCRDDAEVSVVVHDVALYGGVGPDGDPPSESVVQDSVEADVGEVASKDGGDLDLSIVLHHAVLHRGVIA